MFSFFFVFFFFPYAVLASEAPWLHLGVIFSHVCWTSEKPSVSLRPYTTGNLNLGSGEHSDSAKAGFGSWWGAFKNLAVEVQQRLLSLVLIWRLLWACVGLTGIPSIAVNAPTQFTTSELFLLMLWHSYKHTQRLVLTCAWNQVLSYWELVLTVWKWCLRN